MLYDRNSDAKRRNDVCIESLVTIITRETWSSGYGRRLMFRRLWLQIPAPYTGWALFHFFVVKL